MAAMAIMILLFFNLLHGFPGKKSASSFCSHILPPFSACFFSRHAQEGVPNLGKAKPLCELRRRRITMLNPRLLAWGIASSRNQRLVEALPGLTSGRVSEAFPFSICLSVCIEIVVPLRGTAFWGLSHPRLKAWG